MGETPRHTPRHNATQPHMMCVNALKHESNDRDNQNNEYTLLANASGGERP